MNWYHRAERRYVEYGSSFEATRAFGLFRSLYDTVYNMNMSHLSDEVETIFERLADHGVRTACTPFLIYRGRTRHELGPRGPAAPRRGRRDLPPRDLGPRRALLRRAVLEPQGSVQADPRPARHARRVLGLLRARARRGRPLRLPALLAARQRLPLAQATGPDGQPESISRADAALGELVDACGGLDRFLDEPRGDRRRRPRPDRRRPRARPRRRAGLASGACSSPTRATPRTPSWRSARRSRAAAVYVIAGERSRARRTPTSASACARLEGVDLFAWLEPTASRCCAATPTGRRPPAPRRSSSATARSCASGPDRPWSTTARRALGPRRRPGALRGADRGADRFDSREYPDALARLWAALTAPHAGEILISAAAGYRVRRLGRGHPLPGRQPRRPARRGLARSAAALRLRAGNRGPARAVGDQRRRRARARALRIAIARDAGARARPASGSQLMATRTARSARLQPPPAERGPPDPPRRPQAGQLDAAREVRLRRRLGLRRQPRRLRRCSRTSPASTTSPPRSGRSSSP